MNKKVIVTILMALVLSGCGLLNNIGLYTSAQYEAQATEIAEQAKQISSLTSENASLQAKVDELVKDKSSLEGQVKNFKDQVTELTQAKNSATADLGKYKSMVCKDLTWAQATDEIRVWPIGEGNAEIDRIQKDTGVSFFLTQMLSLSEPISEDALYYVLVADFYNGIILNSQDGCMIFNEKDWDFSQSA